MQFQVPQFIEVESKLVGPLTLRQFLYLAAAGGASFLAFFVFKTWLWFLISAISFTFGIALAFYKYNGQPLPKIIFYAFSFLWKPKLYIWKREAEKAAGLPETPEIKRKNLFQMPSMKKLMQDLMISKQPISQREKVVSPIVGEKMKEGYAVLKKTTGEKKVAKQVNY
ncbi:PrgI family protein [Candidatus Wolfebacteria bacterium]|nr:PrgI family protein [Candidatus Wolfebacteria bacterium]